MATLIRRYVFHASWLFGRKHAEWSVFVKKRFDLHYTIVINYKFVHLGARVLEESRS
jgi:hypothetical protein